MLGFDVRTSELARFIPREKNHAPGLLGIPFKHSSYRLLPLQSSRADPRPASRRKSPALQSDYRVSRTPRGKYLQPSAPPQAEVSGHTDWRTLYCALRKRKSADFYGELH